MPMSWPMTAAASHDVSLVTHNMTLPAWSVTGADCKAFKTLGLKATFYNDSDMLAAFPLLSHKRAHSTTPPPVPGGQLAQQRRAVASGWKPQQQHTSAVSCFESHGCVQHKSVLAAGLHISPYVSSRQPMLNMSTA
jgi:hypothetical protein